LKIKFEKADQLFIEMFRSNRQKGKEK